jgi:hypothetical protein
LPCYHSAQEKNRLLADLKRLKEHYSKYEPTILELKKRFEAALREKALLALERDKCKCKVGRKGVLGGGRQVGRGGPKLDRPRLQVMLR